MEAEAPLKIKIFLRKRDAFTENIINTSQSIL